MVRPIFFLTALAAASSASATTYSASVAGTTAARIIARDIVWNCASGACRGSTEDSRPALLCQSLAKRAGKVGSFSIDGREFTASELDKCNAAAKSGSDKAIAAQ